MDYSAPMAELENLSDFVEVIYDIELICIVYFL